MPSRPHYAGAFAAFEPGLFARGGGGGGFKRVKFMIVRNTLICREGGLPSMVTRGGLCSQSMLLSGFSIPHHQEYAIDPPVPLAPWQKSYQFICTTRLINDPKSEHVSAQNLDRWSERDKAVFKERFLATPKNFTSIASYVGKPVSECVHYYYLSKKTEGYKALVKKHTSRRSRTRPSDKNGPTGTSHSTSGHRPVRTATPASGSHGNEAGGGRATPNDVKAEEGHAPTKKSGGSSRGRSGRNRGHVGDSHHRSTKGSNRSAVTGAAPASSTASTTNSTAAAVATETTTEHPPSEAPQTTADVKPENTDTSAGLSSSKTDVKHEDTSSTTESASRPATTAVDRKADVENTALSTAKPENVTQMPVETSTASTVVSAAPSTSASTAGATAPTPLEASSSNVTLSDNSMLSQPTLLSSQPTISNTADSPGRSGSSASIQDLIHLTIEKNYSQPPGLPTNTVDLTVKTPRPSQQAHPPSTEPRRLVSPTLQPTTNSLPEVINLARSSPFTRGATPESNLPAESMRLPPRPSPQQTFPPAVSASASLPPTSLSSGKLYLFAVAMCH
ncbi:unnamed protein product [Schistocephalus solidus]|uniref:SANT domain-containing protein n=1 Tax=Schistocephalus solidus TaxID=70667 RepID=A0A183TKW0_SCHSO|nr:unnamed protein product [Schistocephalus solidus]